MRTLEPPPGGREEGGNRGVMGYRFSLGRSKKVVLGEGDDGGASGAAQEEPHIIHNIDKFIHVFTVVTVIRG